MRAWCARELEEQGIHFAPVQANMQFSPHKGTIRGLHLQIAPALEAKLVRCTRGAIFDVAVDLRPNSPTFGKWCGTELTAENGRMLYVPEQCAHGFQSIEENSEVMYLTSAFYAPQWCRGARFDDPAFGIRWPSAGFRDLGAGSQLAVDAGTKSRDRNEHPYGREILMKSGYCSFATWSPTATRSG